MNRLDSLPPATRGAFFYLIFYGTLAVYIPFLNVYLRKLGFSGWEIGLLAALLPAVTFLTAAPMSFLADRRAWHVRMLTVSSLGLGLVLLLFIFPTGFWVLFLLMALRALFFSPMTPLADSLIARMAARHNLNYGGMRLFGSLSFALVAVACGALWQNFGFLPMFVASALLYGAVTWNASTLEGGSVIERQSRVPLRLVWRDAFLVAVMLASFLVASAIGMDLTFSGIYMTRLGGNDLMVGLLFCVSALCELPTMRYSAGVAERLGGPGALLAAYGLFALAYAAYALSPGPPFLLAAGCIRGLAYGLFYASTIRLVNDRTPPEWSATALSMINGTAFGLAQLIAGPVSGRIYDAFGPVTVYVVAAGGAALAMIVMAAVVASGLANRNREMSSVGEKYIPRTGTRGTESVGSLPLERRQGSAGMREERYMTELARQHAAADGTAPRLSDQETQDRLEQVPGWDIVNDRLTRDVKLKNFKEALSLVNRIGDLAEQENHHPDICLHSWNHVRLELYTHTAHGISQNDFVMAAKFNEVLPPQ